MGMGLGGIIFGALVALLGFFTYRRSRVAMVLAILLYAANGQYTLATPEERAARPQRSASSCASTSSTPWCGR